MIDFQSIANLTADTYANKQCNFLLKILELLQELDL